MNWAFREQQNISSAFYNQRQATIYTAIAYFNQPGNEETKKTIVIISDCWKKHMAAEVFAYNTVINKWLDTWFPERNHMYYFSDGAPGHYKVREALKKLPPPLTPIV